MLDAFDVANHWPWIVRAIGLPERSRAAELLWLLAEAQYDAGGAHVEMSRVLRRHGWKPGELGTARDLLRDLAAAGVVWRYPGSGRRGSAWTFTTGLGHRWRLPWLRSALIVEEQVTHCLCRGISPVVAEMPGQGVPLSRSQRQIQLPPAAHLGVRLRDNGGKSATTGAAQERFLTTLRDNGGPPSTPIPSISRTSKTSSSSDDDEGLRMLKTAVEEGTGERLWGAPLEELRSVAGRCDSDELAELAAELRARGEGGTKSPAVLARQAGELLRIIQGERHTAKIEELEQARRRLQVLRRLPELDDELTQELEQLSGILEADG